MNYKKIFRVVFIVLCIATFSFGGEKLLDWTPDGKYAAVGGNGRSLYICDGQGKLSEKIFDEVWATQWLKDSESLLVVRHYECKNWQDIEKYADKSVQEMMIKKAGEICKLANREQLEELQVSEEIEKMWEFDSGEYDDIMQGAKAYLAEKKPEGMSDFMKEYCLAKFSYDLYCLDMVNWNGKAITGEKRICQFTKEVFDINLSDDEKFAAVSIKRSGRVRTETELWVADMSDGHNIRIATDNAVYPDWIPGSYKLMYVSGVRSSIGKLNEADKNGKLKSGELFNAYSENYDDSSSQTIVVVRASIDTKVRCLRNGRVIFSSKEMVIPALEKEFSERVQLFMLDTNVIERVSRITNEQFHDRIKWFDSEIFEISSDEKYILMADRVCNIAIMELATGEVTEIESTLETHGNDLDCIPSWRTNSEFCYLVRCGCEESGEKKSDNIAGSVKNLSHIFLR